MLESASWLWRSCPGRGLTLLRKTVTWPRATSMCASMASRDLKSGIYLRALVWLVRLRNVEGWHDLNRHGGTHVRRIRLRAET